MKSVLFSCAVFLLINFSEIEAVERLMCPPETSNGQFPNRIETRERLSRLRAEMKRPTSLADANPLEAYIITNFDAHQSQLLSHRDRRLEYISGFVGKKGLAVVTKDKANIWIDDSEITQANEMLSCEWSIDSLTKPEVSVAEWLRKSLRSYSRIGVDPTLVPYDIWETFSPNKIVSIKNNLIDTIWISRPTHSNYEAKMIPIEYTGKTWLDKVTEVREALKRENCDAMVVTALDEISWLLNVRGVHIDHLPVIRAYVIISEAQLHLYTDTRKLHLQVNSTLKTENCFSSQCVRLHDYNAVWGDMKTFTQIWRKFCIPAKAPFSPYASKAVYDTIPPDNRILKMSPILQLKAIKNEVESKGMRNAHVKDAVAFCAAMANIELKMKNGEQWDELGIGHEIDSYRLEQYHATGSSFDTVIAFGAHSSFSYHLNNITSLKMDNSSVLLVNTGGQYFDGTTSVTRTFTFGTPTEEQIDIYTRILKGLIDFSSLSFPSSLKLHEADLLARAPLWDQALDYNHETGHGIGSHLSAEEGPILIDSSHHTGETFKEGYFIAIGPSYTKKHKYGIRLRNVLEVIKDEDGRSENQLTFQTATLIPFEPKLINTKLLSPEQIMWINKYNTRIRDEIGAELKKQRKMKGFYWMMEKAQNIPDKFLDRTSSAIQFIPHDKLIFSLLLSLISCTFIYL